MKLHPIESVKSLTRLLCTASLVLLCVSMAGAAETWQAGTAKAVITPEKPLWMAGYGNRDRPAEGKVHDLWIRVLALEDAAGHRAIVLSSDTLGISRSIYDNTCAALQDKFDLGRGQIMLHSSHTHCGPVLRGALHDIYPLDEQQLQWIDEYSTRLEGQILDAVGRALADLEPVRLYGGQGEADFAVNRRNNLEPEVPKLREQDALQGPFDHSVPTLAVLSADGDQLKAVVYGYACHNTTLSFYQWCGDYAGFSQLALEERHPGCTAMFYMGCGADQNPLPRRTVELSQGYGVRLADAVDAVLDGSMQELAPTLETAYERVTLRLGTEPTRDELEKQSTAGSVYQQRWARRLLKQLSEGRQLAREYPLPVQVWRLGGEQLWITIGGEVVVDYALGFKKTYGEDVWVAGYCNDVPAYIPSLRVLEEDVPPRASNRWGYEGNTSMVVYGMPAYRWADDVEERIVASVKRLVESVNGE